MDTIIRDIFRVAFGMTAVLFINPIWGQMKQANEAFAHHHYDAAIQLYEKVIRKDLDNGEAVTSLAICYWKTEQNIQAEYWFNRAVYMNEDPEVKLRYSQSLINNEKYEMAIKWLDKYIQAETDETKIKRAQHLSGYCVALMNGTPLDERCELEPSTFNSPSLDFAPHFHNGKVYFITNRKGVTERGGELDPWTSQRFTDVFEVNGNEASPMNLKGVALSPYHEGPMCFSKGGDELYMTVSDFDEKKRKFDKQKNTRVTIVSYHLEGDTWIFQGKLPFHSSEFNSVHPALSPDGLSLVFASDQSGGHGGMDLYISHRESKKSAWGTPELFSTEINTEGNELFPSFDDDGNLYFSSDLLIGLGGLDIFKCETTSTGFGKPENLGAPLNSPKDDFGICWKDHKSGYLSSNRNATEGDEILSFQYVEGIRVEGFVQDCSNGMPLAGATVKLTFNQEERQTYTHVNGSWSVLLPMTDAVTISSELTGYETSSACVNEQTFNLTGMLNGDVLQVSSYLSRNAREISSNHYVRGQVLEMPFGTPMSDVRIQAYQGEKQIQSFHSNAWGAFAMVVLPNQEYVFTVDFSDGRADTLNFLSSTENLQDPILFEFWTESPIAKKEVVLSADMPVYNNQVIQLYHIYFERNDISLNANAEGDLDILFEVLQKHPKMKGEIMAHADARASHAYNFKLSQERADAARTYLVKKGIDPFRLRAHGYGETMPKTHCPSPESCSEEEHARNRRVEFRVIDTGEGIDTISRESVRFTSN